jgi:hypothetical protein
VSKRRNGGRKAPGGSLYLGQPVAAKGSGISIGVPGCTIFGTGPSLAGNFLTTETGDNLITEDTSAQIVTET